MTQVFGSKREKYNFYNYLVVLVKALETHYTVIDLRNESCVTGLIKHVDGLMNIDMENATYYDPRGKMYKFNNFFINARNIVYVHIPENMSSIDLINTQLSLLGAPKTRGQKKPNYKSVRAKRYQAEILKSLKEQKAGPSKEN